MSTPSTPLENALVLALEATERVLKEHVPGIAFVAADVTTSDTPTMALSVTGAAEGTMFIGLSDSDDLASLLSAHHDAVGAAISIDLSAALDEQLVVAASPLDVDAIPTIDPVVRATLDGLGGPATLWIGVDSGLGSTIGSMVASRLDSLGSSDDKGELEVLDAEFPQIAGGSSSHQAKDMSLLKDVNLTVTVELGRTSMKVRDLLELGSGSVVELDRTAGSPVEVLVNGTIVARGEVVVVDDELGVRVTEVVRTDEAVTL